MKKHLLHIGLLLTLIGTPLLAQGETITCTEQGTSGYVCSGYDGMEKPGNCDLTAPKTEYSWITSDVELDCSGWPNGYTCTGIGNSTSRSCDLAALLCVGSAGSYECVLPVSGVPLSGCSSSDAGMHCTNLPAGYIVDATQSASQTQNQTQNTTQTTNTQTYSASGGGKAGNNGSSNLTYVPLEPLVGVDQSGQAQFADLVTGFFKILVNVGAFVAVTMLVVGGITYMVSEQTFKKLVARERIKAAFFGMGILAGAWLLLHTINPNLLMFDKNLLNPAEYQQQTQTGTQAGASSSGLSGCQGNQPIGCQLPCTKACVDAINIASANKLQTGTSWTALWYRTADVSNTAASNEISAFSNLCSGKVETGTAETSKGESLTAFVCVQ